MRGGRGCANNPPKGLRVAYPSTTSTSDTSAHPHRLQHRHCRVQILWVVDCSHGGKCQRCHNQGTHATPNSPMCSVDKSGHAKGEGVP